MRIASLLPGATEIVAALGLADRLVGRSYECDWPPEVAEVPAVVVGGLDADPADSAGIDRAVASAARAGTALARIDRDALRRARPDVLIAQGLCGVCAVGAEEAEEAAAGLPGRPEVVTLEATTLEGVMESVLLVGAATGALAAAERTVAGLRARLEEVRERVAGRPRRRVVCLEWLEPPFAAGHWVPEQVALAGGEEALGRAGAPSVRVRAEDVVAARPEVLVLMPCGWTPADTLAALDRDALVDAYGATPAVGAGEVVAVDGSAHFSRPGPRLVDGVEVLASVLHPAAAGAPPPGAALRVPPARAVATPRH